jgi:hypothetical protein
MNAIRQFIDVKDNAFNVRLPKNFKANRVEVIIIPSEIDFEFAHWQKKEAIRRLEIYKKEPKSALYFGQIMDEIESEL